MSVSISISTINIHIDFIFVVFIAQSFASALSKRDINAFRQVLQSASDVEKYDSENHMSIFEQCCQTPGCAEFIDECILAGCDVNKVIYLSKNYGNSSFFYHKKPNFYIKKVKLFHFDSATDFSPLCGAQQ